MRIMRITAVLAVLLLPVSTFGQEQLLTLQNSGLLVGKQVIVHRLPLCQPGTFKSDLEHAGMKAKVISAKAINLPPVSKSTLDRMAPSMRDILLDEQKAATLVLQFEDGATFDTCAPIGPKLLAENLELAPGETLDTPKATENLQAASPNPSANDELPDAEVNAALNGAGRDHWVNIEDAGLMAHQGSRAPSITLFLPDAVLAIRSETAKKQFMSYVPTEDDRKRALMVVAAGFVSEIVQGGCDSITRVVLLSDPAGTVKKEAYLSEPLGSTWRNGFGASNYCESLRAKFLLSDVQQVRAAAQNGEFYVAVFAGSVNTKIYKIKRKHQSKLGLM